MPQHPAALVLLGDALNGLVRRHEDLRAYKDAEKNAKVYLEPPKSVGARPRRGQHPGYAWLRLVKLDRLFSLSCNFKSKIAELHIEKDHADEVENYTPKAANMS